VRKGYQVTVRMNDGASRAFVDTRPGNWRRGERVILLQDVGNAGR
jgi:hypothetical protein